MKAEDLNKLPRYITAPASEMWGPMPEGFHIANEDAVFVKLKDVEALFPRTVTIHEKIIVQDGVEYVSVGRGGRYLIDAVKNHNWKLYSFGSHIGTCTCEGPWFGDDPDWEYFIKKEPNA